jgi:hypothetical protein
MLWKTEFISAELQGVFLLKGMVESFVEFLDPVCIDVLGRQIAGQPFQHFTTLVNLDDLLVGELLDHRRLPW